MLCLQRRQFLVDGMYEATVGKEGGPIPRDRLVLKLRKKIEFHQKDQGRLAVKWTSSYYVYMLVMGPAANCRAGLQASNLARTPPTRSRRLVVLVAVKTAQQRMMGYN